MMPTWKVMIPPGDRSLDELVKKARRLQRETKEILAHINGARVDFLMKELEVGSTLARLAQDSHVMGSPGSRDRQKFRAQEACRGILRFRRLAKLTVAEEIGIENGLAEIEAILKKLP